MLLYNSGSSELLINHYILLRGVYKSFLFILFLFPNLNEYIVQPLLLPKSLRELIW